MPNNQKQSPNIFSPSAYLGIPGNQTPGTIDSDFTYTYTVSLTANQLLTNQGVLVYTDADFAMRALILATYTGPFQIQLSDASGYYLSSNMLLYSIFLQNFAPFPFPFVPEIIIPAGGRIGINIQDLSGAGNTIQIAFRGAKKFSIAQANSNAANS